jgi:serine phosphatase RsbU (regulator of sigma subunit)
MKRLKWVAAQVCFIIPFLLVGFFLGQGRQLREQGFREKTFRELDDTLFRLRRNEETEKYLADVITRVCEQASASPHPAAFLRPRLRALKRRFPANLRCTVLDSEGNIIAGVTDGTPPRVILQRIGKALTSAWGLEDTSNPERASGEDPKRLELLSTYWKQIRSFLGPKADEASFCRPFVRFQEVSYRLEKRWLFAVLKPRFLLLVHADHSENWSALGLQDRCRMFNHLHQTSTVRAGVFEEGRAAKVSLGEVAPAGLPQAIQRFRANCETHSFGKRHLIGISPVSPFQFLWVTKPWKQTDWASGFHVAFLAAGVLCYGLFAVFSYRTLITVPPVRFPIRWRLSLMFGFVGGLPLLVIVLTGWNFLEQLSRTRTNEAREAGVSILRAFDQGFPLALGRIQKRLIEKFGVSGFDPGPERDRTVRWIRKFWEKLSRPDIVVVDRAGTVVWTITPTEPQNANIRKTAATLCGGLLQNLEGPDDSGVLIGQFLQGKSNNPFAEFLRSVGKLGELRILGVQAFVWFYPLREKDGSRRYFLHFYWVREEIERLYIEMNLLSVQRRNPDFRLFAAPLGNLERHLPNPFPWFARCRKLLNRISRTTDVVQETIIGDTGRFLAVAIRPKSLSESILGAMKDEAGLHRELAWGKRFLWGFILLSASLSLIFGLLLSSAFLEPIRNLENGARAIQARNFQYQIPMTDEYELGKLGKLLNEALIGMADLEVAKMVQANLFPTSEIRSGPFRIFGKSCPKAGLGGDFFDIVSLKDGRIFLLIGEVAGSGVKAGLVMAMAKGLMISSLQRINLAQEKADLPGILAHLQEILFQRIGLKTAMSCFLAVLHPSDSLLEMANAGQHLPVLFREGNSPGRLPISSSAAFRGESDPISRIASASCEIRPGDRLFFYTGGFLKSRKADEESFLAEFDDQPFSVLLPLLEDSPQESLQNLQAREEKEGRGMPREKDVTMLLLTREKSG